MRLDNYIYEKGLFSSRTKANEAAKNNEVYVNGVSQKPSFQVNGDEEITIKEKLRFVSNGGYKLEKALNDFKFNISGMTAADIGASTGGFTDCLLKRNIKKVYAIDVGKNLLDSSIKNNSKVVSIENFNAKNINENSLFEKVDLIVVDCSFISLKLIIKPIINILKSNGKIIALIKPQFEVGKQNANKSGIVLKQSLRLNVVNELCNFINSIGLKVVNFTVAPIIEKKNIEYLIMLDKYSSEIEKSKIESIVKGEIYK